MARALAIHEGIIRRGLIKELEEFRAAGQRVSSYYIDLDGRVGTNTEAMRLMAKNALKEFRKQREQLDVPHEQQQALRHDWELVQELAGTIVGERGTRALACFVASQADFSRILRLPLPVRNRAFFEERFVLWPLYQVLDQADRYAIALTDKEKARLFLYYLEQIEEITDIIEEIPGKVRYPDPVTVWHYMNKHIEKFHHHFENVAQTLLRQFEQEPFEHLIIGARTETLPWFESHLHRYLSGRVIARWEADVKAPTPQIHERAIQEEEQFLQRQAQDIWQTIQDYRRQRGALGPDEVFASLWQRRVQALLETPQVVRAGFRCSACSRLQLRNGPCVECGGKLTEVADVYEEAVHDAIEQDAHVRFWKDPTLKAVESIAALKRF